jgi:hypothetical protein
VGASLAPTGPWWRVAWPQSLPAVAPLVAGPWWGWPLGGWPLGGLVRLSSAATAITTSTGSTSSIASSTRCSGICSIGIESSPAGLHPAWVRIWFLDGAAQPVRPCRLVPAVVAQRRGLELQEQCGAESLWML